MKKQKTTVIFIFVSIIIVSVITVSKLIITYFTTYNSAQMALANQYTKIAQNIANSINPNTYRNVLEKRVRDDEYSKVSNFLNEYRNKTKALYIYTLLFDESDIAKVLVVATPPELPIGEINCTLPKKQVRLVKQGIPSFTKIIHDHEYGTYLSTVAPIFDENKKVIGAVGIDISIDSLNEVGKQVIQNNSIVFTMDIIFALLIVVTIFFLRYWYQKVLHRQLKESEFFYISELNKVLGSLKSTRHDLNNHFQVIIGLMEMQLFEKASEYLKALYKETRVLDLSVKVQHPALLVLLSSKWEVAQSKDIQIQIEADKSDFRHIETTDLIRIFSNLIDNAIEATEKLPSKIGHIHVLCKNVGNTYIFSVENNVDHNVFRENMLFKEGFTTKSSKDKEQGIHERGAGLSIIKSTVDKYNGAIYHRLKNNRLLIQITITYNN